MHCCIPGCYNTYKKSKGKPKDVKFYYFPVKSIHMPWLTEKRNKWINAVIKHAKHPNWHPSKYSTICSAHFIGQKKSENPLHPAYIPTIFPGGEKRINLDKKIERFQRYQHRMQRFASKDSLEKSCPELNTEDSEELEPSCRSVGSQKDDTSSGNKIYSAVFLCNLNNINGVCTAEVQTDITSKIVTDRSCEAKIEVVNKVMKDFSCDPIDQNSQSLLCPGFHGISSIKTEENLTNLTVAGAATTSPDLHYIEQSLSSHSDIGNSPSRPFLKEEEEEDRFIGAW